MGSKKRYKSIYEEIAAVKADLEREIALWHKIKENGCSDPFWPDGTNMNLVRNHIIYDLRRLDELEQKPVQITMFMLIDRSGNIENDKRVPPIVPNDYMANERRCSYFL